RPRRAVPGRDVRGGNSAGTGEAAADDQPTVPAHERGREVVDPADTGPEALPGAAIPARDVPGAAEAELTGGVERTLVFREAGDAVGQLCAPGAERRPRAAVPPRDRLDRRDLERAAEHDLRSERAETVRRTADAARERGPAAAVPRADTVHAHAARAVPGAPLEAGHVEPVVRHGRVDRVVVEPRHA